MAPRPPSDAVVALRSLGRRYRGLFAGLGDDESPDDLAHRPGPDGQSALDHVRGATAAVSIGARALGDALGSGASAALPPAVDRVDDALEGLSLVAGTLADQAEHVAADDWARPGATSALWDAVDAAVEHLRAAETTLAAVRGKG
jgi:hypothetical protein